MANPPKKKKPLIVRAARDLTVSARPIQDSFRLSKSVVDSLRDRLSQIKNNPRGNIDEAPSTEQLTPEACFLAWLGRAIVAQGFTSVEDLNTHLDDLTYRAVGIARIMTIIAIVLMLTSLLMLTFMQTGFFGWFNGTLWVAVSTVMVAQVRFRAWWLTRRIGGISFLTWFRKGGIFTPLYAEKFSPASYTTLDFPFVKFAQPATEKPPTATPTSAAE